MKKLLSLILAMMLVVGMLPVAFASTSTDPIEYIITWNSMKTVPTATVTDFTLFDTYEEMNDEYPLWAYNNSYVSGGSKNFIGTRMMIASSQTSMQEGKSFLNLKLKVENPGWYDVSILVGEYMYGAGANIYLGPVNRATWAPAYLSELTYVGHVETYVDGGSARTFDAPRDVGKTYIPEAGDYYIAFVFTDGGHANASNSREMFYLSQITLTPTPPSSIELSAESITVDEGATSDAITATVKDASGNTLEGATVTYSIDDEDVATVDAATGAVTGVKKGTATVTATVTGYDVTKTIPVTVNGEEEPPVEPDDSVNYIITWNSMKTVPTSTVSDFTLFDTYEEMNDEYPLWAYNNRYNSGGGQNFIGTRLMITSSDTSVKEGTAFLNLKLKVENPGWYDLSVLIDEYIYGAGADIYLGKVNRESWAPSYLYELNKIGHIETYATKTTNSFDIKRDVGKAYIPEAGDYYIAFIFTDGGHAHPTNSRQGFYLSQITLDPTTAPVVESEAVTAKDSTVTVSVEGAETIVGIDDPEVVNQVNLGTAVTVTAAETNADGKAFAGWYRGGDNGVFVSNELSYTFNAFTNFTLKAVYNDAEEVAEGDVDVEFYKQDGTYVSKTSVASGTRGADVTAPTGVSLIGHTLDGWFVDEDTTLAELPTITKLTRAVARFTAKTLDKDTYGSLLYNGKTQSTTYGAMISDTVDGATFWMRDGKVVDYGDTYTYYRWGQGNIVACTGSIDVKPVIYLDDDTMDGAYMIEYDKGNSERVVEAGIIFTNDASSTVKSYNGERYASQRNGDHGQFAAAPSDTYSYARGYLIYETATGYEVIHTDAVAIG